LNGADGGGKKREWCYVSVGKRKKGRNRTPQSITSFSLGRNLQQGVLEEWGKGWGGVKKKGGIISSTKKGKKKKEQKGRHLGASESSGEGGKWKKTLRNPENAATKARFRGELGSKKKKKVLPRNDGPSGRSANRGGGGGGVISPGLNPKEKRSHQKKDPVKKKKKKPLIRKRGGGLIRSAAPRDE